MLAVLVASAILAGPRAEKQSFDARAFAQGKPNVLLITLDTTRADRMGFLGSVRGLTPALDAFARTATVFSRAYAQAPVTTVSHATLLTGMYPPSHHVDQFGAPLAASVPYVPELVKREQIASAVALDRSVFHGSRLIGPSLAGLFVGWWGAASAFFANAFSFLALIIALISLPRRPVGTKEEEEKRRSGIMEGFRYVRSDRTILSMIVLIALTTIFIFPTISVMLPLYVRNVLQLGPDSMGWLMATSGTGAFLGSLGLLSIAREKRLKFMSGNVLAIAAGVFFMSRSHSFLLTACSMGILAIALSMNFGLANTIVQEHAPSHLRGRVSAVFGLSFFGLMPIAGLIVTGFSDLIGMRAALAVASVIYGIAAFYVLSLAGRHVCDRPVSPVPESELAPVA